MCLYLDQFFKPFNFLPFQLSSHIKGALHPALQKNWTIVAGAKKAAIYRLLWPFFGQPLYIGSIAAFFGTTAMV